MRQIVEVQIQPDALNRNGNKKRNQHNAIVYKVVEIKD